MKFNRWWVLMWAFNVVVLVVLLASHAKPAVWLSVAAVLFFLPEWLGLRVSNDQWPPLTQVVRKYVPRWMVYPALGAAATWAIIHWWDRPHHVLISVIIVAVAFWMADHFDTTFDQPSGG